jgi:phosphatidylserine/phosphatidylglycerophosphate/cardiolipin synthase-like enzyme
MKFVSTSVFIVLMSLSAWGQTTVTWNFGITSGNASPSGGTPVSNLVISDVSQGNNNGTTTILTTTSASSGYTGASGSYNAGAAARVGVLNTAAGGSAYFEFTLTPSTGYSVTLSSVSFGTRSTSTGPQAYTLRCSSDSYASDQATGSISNNSTWALESNSSLSITSSSGAPITFRIYGYNGAGSPASGTANWRIDDLSLAVTVNAVNPTGSGIGTANISPSTILAGKTSDLTIKLESDASDTIANVVIVVASVFTWSMNSSGVSLVGKSLTAATLSVNQDTINISSATVTKTDTAQIVIHSVSAPDSAVAGNFILETAVANVSPSPVSSPLTVTVTKLVRIIDLHINDSLGVPAAPYQIGTIVTVSGIITANFVGTSNVNLFLQDATAGINVFINSLNSPFQVGDSATFTGTIDQYRGTTEIDPDSTKWIIYSHNNPLPVPLLLTCADVNQTFNDDYTEPNEGRLVRVNGVTYNSANETITDITGTTGGYIPASLTAPAGTFDLIGILKQYKPGTSSTLTPPYTANYEVDARTQSDIVTSAGPAFVESPTEENIGPNSVTIYFKTVPASKTVVRYGTSSTYGDSVVVSSADTNHSVILNNLWPATVYHYQVSASDQAGTNTTGDAIFSTASPTGTTETINVYFNYPTNSSVADGELAQTVDIVNKFLARIDSAKHSIDLALYSFSGTVGSTIASHLLSAKARGVAIRMIVEVTNSNTSAMNTMKASVPFITGAFDPNRKDGIMHNKFAVFDFRDTSSFTDDWVWTGSWNATDEGDNEDAQNTIEIQDKALANAYTMEFNEMWGSSTDTPDSTRSLFGADKKDITPHKFSIGGTPVELYFSPSDQTTLHIYETLAAAAYSINVCMYTFTRSDLAQELVTKKAAGDKVRVVMDNNTDTGNQFSFLQTNGIDVHLKGSEVTGLLHHKYAVIDAEYPNADAVVTTGSHNWSTSAETSNDENELIIHSKRIADLYLQEFKARYLGAGGTDNIVLGVKKTGDELPKSFGLSQNYPNPFNPSTEIGYQLSAVSHVTLKVFDVLGREITTLVNQRQNAGYYSVTFDAGRFSSGVYFYVLNAGGKLFVKKMLMVK